MFATETEYCGIKAVTFSPYYNTCIASVGKTDLSKMFVAIKVGCDLHVRMRPKNFHNIGGRVCGDGAVRQATGFFLSTLRDSRVYMLFVVQRTCLVRDANNIMLTGSLAESVTSRIAQTTSCAAYKEWDFRCTNVVGTCRANSMVL